MTSHPKKVLLVEDNSFVAKAHTLMLQRLGCQVVAALTGEEALIKSEEQDFDFIFMDMGLPDISGEYVIAGIRHSESERNSQCPIIVLTGYGNEEIHQLAFAAGANEVIIKPLPMERLQQILQTKFK